MSRRSPVHPHHDEPARSSAEVSAESDIGVDHDQAARSARCTRLIADIDRVRVLASSHEGEDPEWREVSALLDSLRATLSRDFSLPSSGTLSFSWRAEAERAHAPTDPMLKTRR